MLYILIKSFRYNYNIINIGSSKVIIEIKYSINFLLNVGYRVFIVYNKDLKGLLSLIYNNY